MQSDPAPFPSSRRVLIQAFTLSLGVAVALGLARFAYALLLPAMRTDLHWTYAQAGTLNTANALGYLLGALLTLLVSRRLGVRRAFLLALLVTALAVLLSGLTSLVPLQLLFRALAGLAGAVTFTGGGVLAARLAVTPTLVSLALTVYYAGAGLAIMLSGLLLPGWLGHFGASAWRSGWVLLGGLSLLATLLVHRFPPPTTDTEGTATTRARWAGVLPILLAHGLFAAGYIAYMTFLIAFVRTRGASPGLVTVLWALLGLSALLSPLIWRTALARWGGEWALTAMLVLTALGAPCRCWATHRRCCWARWWCSAPP